VLINIPSILTSARSAALVMLMGLTLIGFVGWFFGATIGFQQNEMTERIPDGLLWRTNQIESRPYARDVLAKLEIADFSGTTGLIAKSLATFVRSLVGAVGSLAAMAIISIYLGAQAERYRSGISRLAPLTAQPRLSKLFDAIALVLGRWLMGQLAMMATVGILSGLGLWALGIKAALVLGLVGGLLSFVPFIGSVIAAVLATLFALAQGPYFAAAVIVMYVGVQFVEGNFITPLIQSEATSLPPVATLLSVISCALLFGPSMAFLAAPVALFFITVVNVLYIEPMNAPCGRPAEAT
jgi:predicted PurR-regulated permease PerM